MLKKVKVLALMTFKCFMEKLEKTQSQWSTHYTNRHLIEKI